MSRVASRRREKPFFTICSTGNDSGLSGLLDGNDSGDGEDIQGC